jgi:hypothetical protein
MEKEMQAAADRRLEEVLAATGARDPRPACREVLREIRRRNEGDYAAAVSDFRDTVLRGIAVEGADPVRTWIEFGVRLAERLAPGRPVVVDGEGRARSYASPPDARELILHLPNDRGARAVPVALPTSSTAAQRATVELLVHGRVKLSEGTEVESLTKERA